MRSSLIIVGISALALGACSKGGVEAKNVFDELLNDDSCLTEGLGKFASSAAEGVVLQGVSIAGELV